MTHDEQTHNALVLSQTGLAHILPESALSATRLVSDVTRLLQQTPESLKEARRQALELVPSDATQKLVTLILQVGTQ